MMSDPRHELFKTIRKLGFVCLTGLCLLLVLLGMHLAVRPIGKAEIYGVCGGGIKPEPVKMKRSIYDVEKLLGIEYDELKGEALFNDYCVSCHEFDVVIVGPGLSGLPDRLPSPPQSWLYKYFKNPDELAKDKYFKSLRKTYKDINFKHHSIQLSDKELRDLSGFLFMY